jgi:hypothetical protein
MPTLFLMLCLLILVVGCIGHSDYCLRRICRTPTAFRRLQRYLRRNGGLVGVLYRLAGKMSR